MKLGQWRFLQELVASEYSFSTMYNVDIVDGQIVGCARIERSMLFGSAKADISVNQPHQESWNALRNVCENIRNGRLSELRFSAGRPTGAKVQTGGRRFRRAVDRQPTA